MIIRLPRRILRHLPRRLALASLALLAAAQLVACTPGCDVISAGTFERIDNPRLKASLDSTVGLFPNLAPYRLATETDEIEARLGTGFGFLYALTGFLERDKLTATVLHPVMTRADGTTSSSQTLPWTTDRDSITWWFDRREKMLAGLDAGPTPSGKAGTMATYYEKAHDLMTSTAARKAFDIKSEPAKLRDAYGHTTLGQCALLSRRLVEAGCRFVGVDHSGWDTHFTCFPSLEKDLIPSVDRAFSALVTDLADRGLLDSTLVVMMGEMGRTPKVNKDAGRDHWSMTQSVLFAGGGVKPGIVIGATDKNSVAPLSDPVSVEDILRTLFHQMGIDSTKVYNTPLGRPVPIVNGGRVLTDLVG